jgi:hypothetical protein
MAADDTQEAQAMHTLIERLKFDVLEAQDNLLMAKVTQSTFAN